MRRKLPQRRRCEVIKFDHIHSDTGNRSPHFATIGYYEDGSVAEIFLDAKKQATDVANLSRDAALILSIAIQWGVPIVEMQSAVGRNEQGMPHTVIGTALDLLLEEKRLVETQLET